MLVRKGLQWTTHIPLYKLTNLEVWHKDTCGQYVTITSHVRFRHVRKNRLLASSYMPVRPPAWKNSAPTGRIFMKFDIYFSKICEKIQVSLKSDNNNGTLHEDLCTFMVICRWILVRMRNVSDKSCRENQNTHFMFNNFFSENRAICEIMWKNMVQPDRPQMTIWYGACALHAG
jgi:hypothetical protein